MDASAETYQPRAIDVLSGRGKATYSHPGNQRYLQVIEATLDDYLVTESKLAKSRVVKSIVCILENEEGRRFLVKNSKTGEWNALDTKAIMDKVGHSLRDMKATKLGRGGRLAREAHYAALEQEINRHRRLSQALALKSQPSCSPAGGIDSLLRHSMLRQMDSQLQQQPLPQLLANSALLHRSAGMNHQLDPAQFRLHSRLVGSSYVGGMEGQIFAESLLASNRRALIQEQQLLDQSILQRSMLRASGTPMMRMGLPGGLIDPDLIYSAGLR